MKPNTPDRNNAIHTDKSDASTDVRVPALLKNIVKTNNDTPMAVVHNLIVLEANEACARMVGAKSPAQLRNLDLSRLMTTQSIGAARKRYARRTAGELPSDSHVYEATGLDGRTMHIEISAVSWPTDPLLTLSVMRDLTETDQTIDRLRASEKLYRTVAETIPVAVVLRDPANRVVYVNDQALEVTGFSKDEIMADAVINSLSEEDRRSLIQDWDEHNQVTPREWLMRLNDGRVHCMLGASRLITDEDGVYCGMCNAFMDITKRKLAERELLVYKQAFDQAADGLVLADLDNHVIVANQAWANMHGLPEDDLAGKHLSIFHTDEQWRDEVQPLQDILPEKGGFVAEVGHMRADGSVFPARMSVAVLKDENGADAGVIAITRDITERKQSELALRQAHEDLARAYDLQRQFLNNVTHEVRTPLTAIKGYAEMLLEGVGGPLNQHQQSMLEKALASCGTLLGIVDDVLETSRMKSGTMEPRPSACKPCQVIEEAVTAAVPQARRKGISLTFECQRDSVTGVYDKEKLRTIATNLITNAVKFTERGGVVVTATTDCKGTEMIVADTGIGIPADGLASIFGEFQQLDQPRKHKPAGFGLGLAIVARMLSAVDGDLVVSSEPGTGTAFTLFVPVLEAEDGRPAAEANGDRE